MNIFDSIEFTHNIAIRIKRGLIMSRKQKSILLKNTDMYNAQAGKRCFILGNGPSLNVDRLDLLKNEDVFTVNQAIRNPMFHELHPKCHFWIDRNFFVINPDNPEDVELLEYMKKIAYSSETINCFYPLDQFDFVNKHGLYIENRTFFLEPRLHLCNYKHFTPDISHLTFSFGTVVQNAIVTAIYMGYKEIYLLGCDSTGIINTLNAALKIQNNDYGYLVSDNEKLRMEKMVARSKVTDYAYSYYMMLKGYDFLYKACQNNNIKLINCSSNSVLDMMPRDSLVNILERKQ